MLDIAKNCASLKLLIFLFVLTLHTLTIPDFQLLVFFTSKDLALTNSSYPFKNWDKNLEQNSS